MCFELINVKTSPFQFSSFDTPFLKWNHCTTQYHMITAVHYIRACILESAAFCCFTHRISISFKHQVFFNTKLLLLVHNLCWCVHNTIIVMYVFYCIILCWCVYNTIIVMYMFYCIIFVQHLCTAHILFIIIYFHLFLYQPWWFLHYCWLARRRTWI